MAKKRLSRQLSVFAVFIFDRKRTRCEYLVSWIELKVLKSNLTSTTTSHVNATERLFTFQFLVLSAWLKCTQNKRTDKCVWNKNEERFFSFAFDETQISVWYSITEYVDILLNNTLLNLNLSLALSLYNISILFPFLSWLLYFVSKISAFDCVLQNDLLVAFWLISF